jgi:Ca2+-transporting ATPase
LSNQHFLIKQLRAAEQLGNVTTIATDKTGTITEGKLKIAAIYPDSPNQVLEAAFLGTAEYSITPVDTIIRERAQALGLTATTLVREHDLGDKKTRATIRRSNGTFALNVSGAPEAVFALCETVSPDARAELGRQTEAGRRVIAVAAKPLTEAEAQLAFDQLEKGMSLSGLIAFEDSPRAHVKETIAATAKAGIRTIMVTGDHPQTAASIAEQVGIDANRVVTGDELEPLTEEALQQTVREVSVFARSTPEVKYRIVRGLQANHEVVAVTGDGINDVLALKAADVGIAMGIRGTDVAREAASVVLADDNFNTIATSIFEGRSFFDNLQKGTKYYLCIKMAMILIFLIPVLLDFPLPFAPVQLILLEMFMDLAASAGFVAEPKEPDVYTRPPRDPNESVFNNQAILDIVIKAGVLFAAVTGIYIYAYQHTASLVEAQTYAFAAWMVGHVVLAFISRSDKELVITTGLFTNRVMTLWALAAFILLLLGIYVPALNDVLKLAFIPVPDLLLTVAVVVVVLSVLELRKVFLGGRRRPVAKAQTA